MNDGKEKYRTDLLSSLKEIDCYLHFDVRIRIRWEGKSGLPVQRMNAAEGLRVFAC